MREVSTPEEVAGCHVVFISKAEGQREAQWLATLKGNPVLTVGESGQTLSRGGVLEFVLDKKRIRFDASSQAIAQARLKISSQMLGSARKVHQPPTGPGK